MQVRLDASSTVLKDQETYNIIGTIPGTEEGMILLSAHYDSYFSGFQDDNAAVAYDAWHSQSRAAVRV